MKKEKIHIQYVRSAIGCSEHHKRVLRGLGLRKLKQVVVRDDTPQIRGMIATIPHLVKVVKGETS